MKSALRDYVNSHFTIDEVYFDLFGKRIPQGKCFCTEHHNVNTPSAKRYGNVIHCFSCNKTYDVYYFLSKYMPQVIDEIKESIILTGSTKEFERIHPVKIDRTKSIDEIIRDITNAI